jgi:hypothetical protein
LVSRSLFFVYLDGAIFAIGHDTPSDGTVTTHQGETMRRSTTILCGLLALCIGCGGPLVMIPGGELSGNIEPVPSDWTFSDEVENIQLETRPSDPYSVNLWGVGDGANFYVASGRGLESAWAKNIEADPDVRLRIGENIYELRAVRTEDPKDRVQFIAAAKIKYDDFEPNEEQAETAVLYRLESR